MSQNAEAEKSLISSFSECVKLPNEVDFVGLVNLAPPPTSVGKAIVHFVASDDDARRVRIDSLQPIVAGKVQINETNKFLKYHIEPGDPYILGWLPIWDQRNLEDTTKFRGWFLLYVSATPVGESTFNLAIQLFGAKHITLAKRALLFQGNNEGQE